MSDDTGERRRSEIESATRLVRIEDKLDAIDAWLARTVTLLYGDNTNNGMRGRVQDLEARQAALERAMDRAQDNRGRFVGWLAAGGLGAIGVWAANRVLGS